MVYSFEPTQNDSIADHEPLINKAKDFPQPTPEEVRIALTVAKVEVRKPDSKWNGKTPIDVVSTYQEALKSTGVEDKTALEERVKRYLIGFWGERALAEVPVSKARTIYAGPDADPEKYNKSHAMDIEEYTGISRKDLLIRRYHLAQSQINKAIIEQAATEFNQENRKDDNRKDILPRNAYEVISVQLDVLNNYDQAVKAWRQDRRNAGFPRIEQLMRWSITNDINRLKKDTWENLNNEEDVKTVHAWSDYLINQQNTLIFHDSDPLLIVKEAARLQKAEEEFVDKLTSLAGVSETDSAVTDELTPQAKHYKNIWQAKMDKVQRYADSYYFNIAIPDAIVLNENNQIFGVMEIKCYTPEEVKRWLESLQHGLENYPDVPRQYGQEGLQVLALTDPKNLDSDVMQFGFNPYAQSRFLNLIEGKPPHKLAKVLREADSMVLRFTDDVEDETLVALGCVMQEYGYTDFIIQKVGLTEEDIALMAQKMLKRDLEAVQANVPDQGKNIFQKLAQPEGWQ